MTIRDILGFAILVVQFALAIPLILGLFRSKVRAGFSLSGEFMWVVAGLGWLAYGIGVSSVPLMISGVLASVTSGIIGVLCWKDGDSAARKSAFLLSGAVLIGITVPTLVWGATGLSISLSVFGVVQFIPQIMKTLRSWEGVMSGAVIFGGVSVAGSFLRSLYSFSWAFYAGAWITWGLSFGTIDWPLVAWGLAGTVAFGLQGLLAYKYYRR